MVRARRLLVGSVAGLLGIAAVAAPALADGDAAADPPTTVATTVVEPTTSVAPATTSPPATEAPDPTTAPPETAVPDTTPPDAAAIAPDSSIGAASADEPAGDQATSGAAPGSPKPPIARRTAVNPGTGTTTTGQPISVVITTPLDGEVFPIGSEVEVTGRVSIGLLGAGISVAYVVDQSGSTSGTGGTGCGDQNGDGSSDEIIDCELLGVSTLNGQFVGKPGVDAGLISFDSTATIQVGFTSPSDPAISTALASLTPTGGTNFDDALAKTVDLFATAPPDNAKITYFFSDGAASVDDGPGSPLSMAVAAGIIINTFSVGDGAAGCGTGSPLLAIADATGGKCIEVTDPSQLSAVINDLRPAGLDKVEVSLDGGPPVEATVDALGFFNAKVTSVKAGPNKILVTAVMDDGTRVSADVTVYGGEAPPPDFHHLHGVGGPNLVSYHTTTYGTLPVTGADSTNVALLGAILALMGLVMVVTSRRLTLLRTGRNAGA